jgi:hypothetical protein
VLIPPILEVFVVWHPDDAAGEGVLATLLDHFHGTAYSGLVGGAVEVYARADGWESTAGSPRPLPGIADLPNDLPQAATTVVVPVLGTNLARAVEAGGDWRAYVEAIVAAAGAGMLAVFPVQADAAAVAGTVLGSLTKDLQHLDHAGVENPTALCRDLAHSITGFVNGTVGQRLQVFISHTKRSSPDEEPDRVSALVALVREVVGATHLQPFFDASDLQPGTDFEAELVAAASSSALLAVRTELYASRDWCQREVLLSKKADMPVVVLYALHDGEERGSFLMDHVPTALCPTAGKEGQRASIESALNKLVDEALKRALWQHQRRLLQSFGFDWLPANAPEPTTLAAWLTNRADSQDQTGPLFVLHPDPPLGPAETEVLEDLAALAGMAGRVEILTPRTFASRGGQVEP